MDVGFWRKWEVRNKYETNKCVDKTRSWDRVDGVVG